jgi:7-carboxy-7-deazaguanine synthase
MAAIPVRNAAERLRITEIFLSLQGETSTVGVPTAFVRLTGCPLRCRYCDTAYAFSGGTIFSLDEVRARVDALGVRHVTVTGGEPLAQPGCIALLRVLCDAGYEVSLETGGALDVCAVDPRVSRVIDLKTPASGECARNLWSNLADLRPNDQIKFVVCDRSDYTWAKQVIAEHRLVDRVCEVLFSPSHTELPPRRLAQWILDDRLPVRMQVQLHKVLWGDEPGR